MLAGAESGETTGAFLINYKKGGHPFLNKVILFPQFPDGAGAGYMLARVQEVTATDLAKQAPTADAKLCKAAPRQSLKRKRVFLQHAEGGGVAVLQDEEGEGERGVATVATGCPPSSAGRPV